MVISPESCWPGQCWTLTCLAGSGSGALPWGMATCDPWPEMQATGTDAAQLALLRLLHLQKVTRLAVRSR